MIRFVLPQMAPLTPESPYVADLLFLSLFFPTLLRQELKWLQNGHVGLSVLLDLKLEQELNLFWNKHMPQFQVGLWRAFPQGRIFYLLLQNRLRGIVWSGLSLFRPTKERVSVLGLLVLREPHESFPSLKCLCISVPFLARSFLGDRVPCLIAIPPLPVAYW